MYRDDVEALQAQVRTLSAELQAEKKAREAADAARKAADAAADEARLAAQRGRPKEESFWRRHGAVVATMTVVMAGAVLGAAQCVKHGQLRKQALLEHRHQLEIERHKKQLDEATAKRITLDERIKDLELACRKRNQGGYSQAGGSSRGAAETLSRSQIQAGMRAIKGQVQGCYDRYQVPGMANVQVKIGRDGTVESVRVVGMFSNTPTGACVRAAARQARFAPFTGDPITITYPFILR
jgi:hypothetical protein